MIKDDEGWGIDVSASGGIGSIIAAVFLAPIVPKWIAGWAMVIAIVFCFVVITWFLLGRKYVISEPLDDTRYIQRVFTNSELLREFQMTGTTILFMVVISLWIGFAGAFWLLDSFIPLFVAIHSLVTVSYPLFKISAVKAEIDEYNKVVPDSSADNSRSSRED